MLVNSKSLVSSFQFVRKQGKWREIFTNLVDQLKFVNYIKCSSKEHIQSSQERETPHQNTFLMRTVSLSDFAGREAGDETLMNLSVGISRS